MPTVTAGIRGFSPVESEDRAVLDGYLESVRERRAQKSGGKDLSALKIPDAPVGELEAVD